MTFGTDWTFVWMRNFGTTLRKAAIVRHHEDTTLMPVANISSRSLQHHNGFRTRYISVDFNVELGHAQV